MSKSIRVQCANLKRYGSHLEKIIEQAKQTSHVQKSANIVFNNTQNTNLQEQLNNIISADKKQYVPNRNCHIYGNKSNTKILEGNNHRKSLSSINKEIKAVAKRIRPVQSRCKSEFVQSPNQRSISLEKKSIDEESSSQISKIEKVELAVQMPIIEEIGAKELLEERINAYQKIILLMKDKYTQLQRETSSYHKVSKHKNSLSKAQSTLLKECEKAQANCNKLNGELCNLYTKVNYALLSADKEKRALSTYIKQLTECIRFKKSFLFHDDKCNANSMLRELEFHRANSNTIQYKILSLSRKSSPNKKRALAKSTYSEI